eukprot:COSAG05_NODE_1630_length_4372_cov_1.241282_2_plen_93_part_00
MIGHNEPTDGVYLADPFALSSEFKQPYGNALNIDEITHVGRISTNATKTILTKVVTLEPDNVAGMKKQSTRILDRSIGAPTRRHYFLLSQSR